MKLLLVVFLFSSLATAGVGGAGNTGDSSIQFTFTKSTAAMILKSVSPKEVLEITGRAPIQKLYEGCRDAMYVGTIKTEIRLVDTINDGGGFKALARRLPDYILEINRREMEKLITAGTFTPSFLASIFLHEVGHDCVLNGRPVDDEYDRDLDALAAALLEASTRSTGTRFIDLDFIEKVKTGVAVSFYDLSAGTRGRITEKFLNYLGDWIFFKSQTHLTFRPAPASDFFAGEATSVFPGWGNSSLPRTFPETMRQVLEKVVAPSFETKSLSRLEQGSVKPLTSALKTQYEEGTADVPSHVRNTLAVSLAPLAEMKVRMEYDLNLFGDLKIREIRVEE